MSMISRLSVFHLNSDVPNPATKTLAPEALCPGNLMPARVAKPWLSLHALPLHSSCRSMWPKPVCDRGCAGRAVADEASMRVCGHGAETLCGEAHACITSACLTRHLRGFGRGLPSNRLRSKIPALVQARGSCFALRPVSALDFHNVEVARDGCGI